MTTDQAQAELTALLDAAVDAIFVVDSSGTILRSNAAAETMFGYSKDELAGQGLEILMPEPDRSHHRQYMDQYMETGLAKIIGIGREIKALRRSGEVFPADLSVGEVAGEESPRFVGLVRDVTDRREAEAAMLQRREEVIRASRLTVMGEMAAALAHELNQPLSAIANYTAACKRLLQRNQPEDREDILNALDQIQGQSLRAGEVIRRMRSFVRTKEPERATVKVSELVAEILPLAQLDAKANNIELNISIADQLAAISADNVQLQQVLLNLIRNGIDAMSATPPENRKLHVKVDSRDDDTIVFRIFDRGSGVTPEVEAKLFHPFFTTKTEGMGMGLAICQTIVQAHGGELRHEPNPEGGAEFYFTIPTQLNQEQ